MYTVKEVAEFLKVSTMTIYRLTEKNTLKFKKVGGQLRFTKKDIAEYLNVNVDEISI